MAFEEESEPAPAWTLYSESQRWTLLAILLLVSVSSFLDRYVLSILLEPIKAEFGVSDAMLGLLSGFAFSLFYAVFGLPVARWADRGNRRTIITLAVAAWSVMTMICGMAQTFWQLVLARVGVGIGEAGAIPPAQSLIGDYFPPDRRALAFGVFTTGATFGYLLGFGGAGYIAQTFGWRAAFIVAGVPGLFIAVIAGLFLSEPRLQLDLQARGAQRETLGQAVAALRSNKSYRIALLGYVSYFLFAYGVMIFAPSFIVRVLHQPLGHAGLQYALVLTGGTLLGTVGGGWVAHKVAQREVRWLARLPSLTCAMGAPLLLTAFAARDYVTFLAISFMGQTVLAAANPAVTAAVHAVCGNARRATAIAVLLFSATLFGGGFGPLITGALSDALSVRYGDNGLRYALMTMTTVLLLPCFAFYRFGRLIVSDLKN